MKNKTKYNKTEEEQELLKKKIEDFFEVPLGLILILTIIAIIWSVVIDDFNLHALKIEFIIFGICMLLVSIEVIVCKRLEKLGLLKPTFRDDFKLPDLQNVLEWIFGFIIFSNIMDRFFGKKK